MELSFKQFDPTENLAQQRDLFKDCFPETNGEVIQEEVHYRWKFHSFPNVVKSYEFACYISSEMVGYYAAIPYRYKIGDKITHVGLVCDVMTSSKQRGKGIFTKMGTYATGLLSSEVPFTMGYPIRKEVIPGHLRVGWKIPFSLPLYIKFLRFDALFRDRKIGFLAPLANGLICIYNGVVRSKLKNKYTFKQSTNICNVNGYDTFISEWCASIPNALIKDLTFAIWRYGAPERTYQFLSIYSAEEKMIGFISFRKIIKEGVPSYGILDYMVLPDYKDCHSFIHRVLTDLAQKEKVEAIMSMMSKTSASEYQMCKNGYLKSPFVFQLIIKNLTKEFNDEELFNEKNWHLMWVDSDDL